MPRYFFHLSFGQRVVPDEEGVELPNRSAARHEALAAMRDLANAKIGGDARRWASWFLEVADSEGQFFRRPIGHPALELVTENLLERRAEQGFPPPEVAGRDCSGDRGAARTKGTIARGHSAPSE
jgi:uncharacterized protein DUF6894